MDAGHSLLFERACPPSQGINTYLHVFAILREGMLARTPIVEHCSRLLQRLLDVVYDTHLLANIVDSVQNHPDACDLSEFFAPCQIRRGTTPDHVRPRVFRERRGRKIQRPVLAVTQRSKVKDGAHRVRGANLVTLLHHEAAVVATSLHYCMLGTRLYNIILNDTFLPSVI